VTTGRQPIGQAGEPVNAAREASLDGGTGRWVGAALPRKEDRRMLLGRGRFVADMTRAGMLHAAFVRSPFPAAGIGVIDTSAATGLPGVEAAFTAADLGDPYLEAVLERLDAPIVITHGTDTMVETGLFLKQHIADPPVPIVFTGAMTPLGFERSDGLQNLTESLLAARLLPPGIWLAMHNQVFPIDRVRKDRETSRFVST